MMDTIAAFGSGQGRSGIAVLRISGPESPRLLRAMLRHAAYPEPRRAAVRRLCSASGEVLDEALVLWMPGPASFTGEDMTELHVHGGTAVKAAVLQAVLSLGARPAEPGEFTRRALLNGRLDLTAVEGLADLIDAETEAQRRQAIRQLDGVLASAVAGWRERLVEALALCEAALDFPDEDDVPTDVSHRVPDVLSAILADLKSVVVQGRRGERLRDGFTVVIAGQPNAGKSTLLNALARRDVAIVSPVPGTTRDAIEVRCDLGGLPVTFVDTAGLRDSDDAIEREGVARASARIGSADLVLWLEPSDLPPAVQPSTGVLSLRVRTKCDLRPDGAESALAVSALTGEGLDRLVEAISIEAAQSLGAGDAVLTRERHRLVLADVEACLNRALHAAQRQAGELVAEDLRLALRALGRVTGAVDVEEVLDHVFASFCIGK